MSFINETILLFINVLHMIVILFVICAPFSGSNYFLTMHLILVPFFLLQWVLNNNTCSLTVAEKFIREQTYGNSSSFLFGFSSSFLFGFRSSFGFGFSSFSFG